MKHAELPQTAQSLAKSRKESASTLHLLAVLADSPTAVGQWLRERSIRTELVLSAVRVLEEPAQSEAWRAAVRPPRELDPERRAAHALVALCKHREAAAYRFFSQCGTDVARLRAQASSLANGSVAARGPRESRLTVSRLPSKPLLAASVPSPVTHSTSRGVAVTAPARAAPKRTDAPASQPMVKKPRKEPGAQTGTKFSYGEHVAEVLATASPTLARAVEIDEARDALGRMDTRVVCIHGEPGVGKTQLLKGLAASLREESPARVLAWIDASRLLAGAVGRGQLSERVAKTESEVLKLADFGAVIFVDQADALLATDDEFSGALRASTSKVHWVLGVGDTARVMWGAREPSAAGWCSDLRLERLGRTAAVSVVEAAAERYAAHHKVCYAPDSAPALVSWVSRYLGDAAPPGPALEALDLAGARARRKETAQVELQDLAELVSKKCGVPAERLLEADDARMARLETALSERVVGHKDALARIARVVRRRASGFGAGRPVGSFLLLGPTGVGKTETAKALAYALFDSESSVCRFDMSEFSESHAVARLLGAPPGYVGHDAGGQLTETLRKKPYQVVLFDEIEKAHADVLLALLQVLDEGRMTDGRGRTIDMRGAVFVLTSNLGSSVYSAPKSRKLGFATEASEATSKRSDSVLAAAKSALAPEFYNRLDEVLVYEPLTRAEVRQIAAGMVAKLGGELLASKGVGLVVSELALDAVLDAGGVDLSMGARPVRRALQREVEGRIAELVVAGAARRGDTVRVEVNHAGQLGFFVDQNEGSNPSSFAGVARNAAR